ncbi:MULTISPECIES: Gfo/Idh/MocA family protein [Massilia]|uniref:Gfo/Idh/MocA family protein n=1 Tax=Massilia haematophila TaxID=457923 RepID=A0ABV7PF62_9BURK|nr:Gfo/Idh/MocA family oxidoreductase [Massilia sp.]
MAELIRWGILGTGGIARAFAHALRQTPDARLVAVGSRTAAGAEAFARDFDARACASYEALVAAPDVDIVYVATPHPMHAANALLALDAGKPVLCEKPFTMNLCQAEQVVALARSRQLFLMEAMWSRFMPALAQLRQIVASGEIGEVGLVQADFGFAATRDPEHRVNKRELGGGALLDLGIYPLSLACALLGPVQEVRAQAVIGDTGVDVCTGFTMLHQGGTMSISNCTLRARTPCELTISGTLGSVRMDRMFHMAQSLTVTNADGATRSVAAPFLGNGYVHEAIAAGEALRAGRIEHPLMTHDDTLAGMRILDEIRVQIGLRYEADQAGAA